MNNDRAIILNSTGTSDFNWQIDHSSLFRLIQALIYLDTENIDENNMKKNNSSID